MRCSKCGADNREVRKFCAKCAAPLAPSCPHCGASNEPGEDFCGECGAPLGKPSARSAKKASHGPIPITETSVFENLEGERKTVTVLFADIKGSMELIGDLDPEDARTIVDPALKLMIDAVHHYEGYVAQSTGDGILALFGAPLAHEDHPQRALFAALRIQAEVRRYAEKLRAEKGVNLQVRVGANTGEVVVREIRTGKHTEYLPIGHSTGVAARLEALAAPDSIVISESVRKLVEGYFVLKPLGPARIKGVSEPLEIYEVRGLGKLRTRLQRAAARGHTKFVGRQREIEAMKHAAELSRTGHGQIVAVVAEAGVGKSRLFHEFKSSESGWMVLEALSVSHGKATAYLPVIELLHGYFWIATEDDQRTRREKVKARILTLDPALEDTRPYLLGLLGLVEGADPLAQMDPQVRRRRTQDAIKRIILRESLNQPLMLVFEDLHQIDDETRAFLSLLGDSIGTSRILLLVNYRPEYSHSWGSKTFYAQVRLDPLGRESAAQMLTTLLGSDEGVIPLKRLIAEKTEGNPLFMEEIHQALIEEGVVVRNGAVKITRPLNTLKIPATVQAILAARIDRLRVAEKQLLQTLAVIGKRFRLNLAAEVVEKSQQELILALDKLQEREFIYEQPSQGDVEYEFKHALTQEVAYNSLLIERRKAQHERTAAAIESLHSANLDDHLSELTNHYGRSANTRKTVEYLWRSGRQAVLRSAYQEGLAHLARGLELVQQLPDDSQRQRARLELDLQMDCGMAILATRGWYVSEFGVAYSRARELCLILGEETRLLQVLFGLRFSHLVRGDLREAKRYADELMKLALGLADEAMLVAAFWALGSSQFYLGEFKAAHASLEEGIRHYNPQVHRAIAFQVGQDPCMNCLCHDAQALWTLGYADRAEQKAAESLALAHRLGHPFSLAYCFTNLALNYLIRHEYARALECCEEGLEVCRKHGFALAEASMKAHAFIARIALGKAITESSLRALGPVPEYQLISTWYRSALAEAIANQGNTTAASAFLDQAFELMERNDERFVEPEIHRIRGELTLKEVSGESATAMAVRTAQTDAELNFRKAVAIAGRGDARMLGLRATVSLSRLLKTVGRSEEARDALSSYYRWFTEGFDTPDLRQAKALLDELSA